RILRRKLVNRFLPSMRCCHFRLACTPTTSRSGSICLASRRILRQNQLTSSSMGLNNRKPEIAPLSGRITSEILCSPPPTRYCHCRNCRDEEPIRRRGGSRRAYPSVGQIGLSG